MFGIEEQLFLDMENRIIFYSYTYQHSTCASKEGSLLRWLEGKKTWLETHETNST